VKPDDGKKMAAAEWARMAGAGPGTMLGT
jgi:hypothetical protein